MGLTLAEYKINYLAISWYKKNPQYYYLGRPYYPRLCSVKLMVLHENWKPKELFHWLFVKKLSNIFRIYGSMFCGNEYMIWIPLPSFMENSLNWKQLWRLRCIITLHWNCWLGIRAALTQLHRDICIMLG